MSDSKLPRNIHRETYRGIDFAINETSVGLVGMLTGEAHYAALRGRHFCRFVADDEIETPTPENMRAAIDRMLSNSPVYTGDVRDRFYQSKR